METAFDKGVKKFTWLMICFMAVMSPMVFLINGFTKHSWGKDTFLFALAIAVGLTPEMLPMIVSVCLSKGAMAMSRKKVIVKKLNSIQNFGAMDVLCTDKTGTLTIDHVILEIHCDVFKNESEEVLRDAYLISHFQTGLKNVLDRAVLKYTELHRELSVEKIAKVDEMPFDFSRRMMSVVVENADGQRQLLTKGAPESVFKKCTHFESAGETFEMEPILVGNLIEQVNSLSEDGFRVLAIANKKVGPQAAYSRADEENLVLTGYLAFLDPPKDTAKTAIAALRQHGVTVKVLTGDNDLVTRKVCTEVGIHAEKILLGNDVEKMSDEQLASVIDDTDVYARLSPAHKKRVVQALQKKGHVVGFMGDGINDAPALRAADVGISVDTAVDIAKESADMILLEKSLMVLEEGVLEGRKVFANILKYIRMGASSNFGNMFSVLGASAWFPFLPMQPLQILTNNLLYDFSQVPIPTDNVAAQYIAKPRPWNISEIAKFILFIGPISSIFDYTTFCVMWFYYKCANINLAPPPELAARFAHAADPDHTYAAALLNTRLVRRIHHDPDPHHPRHPHQPDSVRSVACELAAHDDHHPDHGHRRVPALFTAGGVAGLCAVDVAILADFIRDPALLCRPDPTHQSVARPPKTGFEAHKPDLSRFIPIYAKRHSFRGAAAAGGLGRRPGLPPEPNCNQSYIFRLTPAGLNCIKCYIFNLC